MIMIKLICLVGLISNKVSKIIVLTMVSSLDYFLNGLIKGVDGYLTKETKRMIFITAYWMLV